VGAAHGDYVRNVTGQIQSWGSAATGPFVASGAAISTVEAAGGNGILAKNFALSRVVPVGNANKPRAWGALACVYLGRPAS